MKETGLWTIRMRHGVCDLEAGVAADEYATSWLEPMRKRGYDDVRIGPAPGLESTFPLNDDDEEEQGPDLSVVATARCPRCGQISCRPGLQVRLAFVCPHCGAGVKPELPIQ